MGYAKGISDDSDIKKLEKKLDSNHEYNAVKLNNKWYLIDSTWEQVIYHMKLLKKNLLLIIFVLLQSY